MVSGLFNLFNRYMDSLGIPLEEQREVDKIKKSLHLDGGKVKTYYKTMVEHWPDEYPEPDAQDPNRNAEISHRTNCPGASAPGRFLFEDICILEQGFRSQSF